MTAAPTSIARSSRWPSTAASSPACRRRAAATKARCTQRSLYADVDVARARRVGLLGDGAHERRVLVLGLDEQLLAFGEVDARAHEQARVGAQARCLDLVGHEPSGEWSRSTRRSTLPLAVLGSSSTNSTSRGYL